jgi:hypothetical protein
MDWTSAASAPSGLHGAPNATNQAWTNLGTSGCDVPHRLYCVEQ